MAIPLQKKEKISLKKVAPSIERVIAKLSWQADKVVGKFDADLSAFVCENRMTTAGVVGPQVIDDVFTCFYNNQETDDHAVKSSGDARGAEGRGSESISIDLGKVDSRAVEIALLVTINDAVKRKQNFGQVTSGEIVVINADTNDELVSFKLDMGSYTTETAIQVASFLKNGSDWEFQANGAGGVKDFIDIAIEDFGYPA